MTQELWPSGAEAELDLIVPSPQILPSNFEPLFWCLNGDSSALTLSSLCLDYLFLSILLMEQMQNSFLSSVINQNHRLAMSGMKAFVHATKVSYISASS